MKRYTKNRFSAYVRKLAAATLLSISLLNAHGELRGHTEIYASNFIALEEYMSVFSLYDDTWLVECEVLREDEDVGVEYGPYYMALAYEAPIKNSIKNKIMGGLSSMELALSGFSIVDVKLNMENIFPLERVDLIREQISKLIGEHSNYLDIREFDMRVFFIKDPGDPLSLSELMAALKRHSFLYFIPDGVPEITSANTFIGNGTV